MFSFFVLSSLFKPATSNTTSYRAFNTQSMRLRSKQILVVPDFWTELSIQLLVWLLLVQSDNTSAHEMPITQLNCNNNAFIYC
jgi:hypothetical protein